LIIGSEVGLTLGHEIELELTLGTTLATKAFGSTLGTSMAGTLGAALGMPFFSLSGVNRSLTPASTEPKVWPRGEMMLPMGPPPEEPVTGGEPTSWVKLPTKGTVSRMPAGVGAAMARNGRAARRKVVVNCILIDLGWLRSVRTV
jgi:hypothetical protein